MMKKLVVSMGLAACAIAAAPAFAGGDCGSMGVDRGNLGNVNPFYYNATFDADGNNLTPADPAGTTDSGIPHQPAYYGHMSTNNTYRFFNVNEMVATMVGDGKHGLWRTQDNGTIREYLTAAAKAGGAGLPASEDPNASELFDEAAEWNNYSHHDAADSWAGYVADGNPVNAGGKQAYVDLPISHAKYAGKYAAHEPLDLPSWYCTMSGPEYKYAREAVRFAFAQDGANQVGPLGKRAGLDVKENYLNVLRLERFPDAEAWVNTGDENNLDWEAIDAQRTPYEVYLVERPFFNEEYLFLTVVFGETGNSKNFSYIRPDGAYYDHLMARKASGEKLARFSTRLEHQPVFAIGRDQAGTNKRSKGRTKAHPTNLFGVHHPGGKVIANGACPALGGDYGADYYGGSWPNTYQEVTPLCDAVLIDVKLWANLDGATWSDKGKHLANAGTDSLTKDYTDIPGVYGAYKDSYLTDRGIKNPEQFTATGTQTKTYQSVRPAVSAKPALPFTPSL